MDTNEIHRLLGQLEASNNQIVKGQQDLKETILSYHQELNTHVQSDTQQLKEIKAKLSKITIALILVILSAGGAVTINFDVLAKAWALF